MGKVSLILESKKCLQCGSLFGRDSCKRVSDFNEKVFCSHPCAKKYSSGANHHLYKSPEEKIKSNIKVDEQTGCWVWQGWWRSKRGKGFYGGVKINGISLFAHRISYEIYKGKIPDGMLCCHKCDNTKCVNPEHLFLGTQDDNMKDMANKFRGTNGEKGHRAKLTKNKVVEIRFAANMGNMLHKEIAKVFGVSTSTITRIVNKKDWKHIL